MAIGEAIGPALPPTEGGGPGEAPPIQTVGDPRLLHLPHVGLISSRSVPADLLLPTLDRCRILREEPISVVGGFQSPLERFALDLLLRGRVPIVVCPARTLAGMRLPTSWRPHIDAGRLAIASTLSERWRRPSSRSAELRNRLVARLADRLFIVHSAPGTRTFRLAVDCIDAGKPVGCFAHPANRELMLVGAEAVPLASAVQETKPAAPGKVSLPAPASLDPGAHAPYSTQTFTLTT
jgi:hypothetical protein